MIQGCSGVAAGVSRDVLWGYFRDARGGIQGCLGCRGCPMGSSYLWASCAMGC